MKRSDYISDLLDSAGHDVWLHAERAMTEKEYNFAKTLITELLPPGPEIDESDFYVMRAGYVFHEYLNTLIFDWSR